MTPVGVAPTGAEASTSEAATSDAATSDVAGVEQTGRTPGDGLASAAPVMLVVGACAAFVAAFRPIADNSVLTHLATGRLLLDGGLPAENPFLYSSTAFPVPSWAWSGALAAAEHVAGVAGVRVLVALVAGLFGAALVALCAPTEGRGRLLEIAVPSGLAALSVVEFLGPRPHLASFALLAAALLVWTRRWSPWWLVGVFAVWINVHGSWVYGLAVLALFAGARAIDDRRVTRGDVLALCSAASGTLIGAVLYPDRFELLLLPLRQFGDPVEREALQVYNEWARPGLGTAMLWPMVALGLLALWGTWRSRRWGSLVASVILVLVGTSGLRMIPIAAISLVPFAAIALRGVGSIPVPSAAGARRTWFVGGVISAAALIAALGVFDPPSQVAGYDLARFDTEAFARLDGAGLISDDVRVLTTVEGGNYLAWRYGDRANAFVDDRPGAAELIDYRRLLRSEDGWEASFDRASPDVVVWPTDGDLVPVLEERGWARAGEFGDHSVLCDPAVAARCTLD